MNTVANKASNGNSQQKLATAWMQERWLQLEKKKLERYILNKKKAKKLKREKLKLQKAKEEKQLKKILYSISAFLIILFSILIFTRKRVLENNSAESIAKVVDIKRNVLKGKTTRQSFAVVEYFVEGVKIKQRTSLYPNTEIGNCYKMRFVIDSPTIFEVDFNDTVSCDF